MNISILIYCILLDYIDGIINIFNFDIDIYMA